MPLIECEQGSEEWKALRAGKITASVAAGCLGHDPDCGPVAAFNRIIGKTVQENNPYLQHGHDNEHRARTYYEIATGRLAVETGFWLHDKFDWLGASPDGLVGDEGGLEVKCPVSKLPEAIPANHEIQCRVNMIVTRRRWWDYLAWMAPAEGETEPRVFGPVRIEHCPAIEAKLIGLLSLWYDMYLAPGTPPPRLRKKLFEGRDIVQEIVFPEARKVCS